MAMPLLNTHSDDSPTPDEVRTALDRISASDAFRGSPQLVAFLRYVVVATLRGEQDRIKGYTIAVEALGRGDDFNPQDDPIVRVEATRLRRALARYYENGGSDDAVQIDLPLGSYVPAFRRAPAGETSLAPAARAAPSLPPALAAPAPRARRTNWRHVALVLFGVALYGALDFVFDFNTPTPQPMPLFLATQLRAAPAAHTPAGYPVVFVGPFTATGAAEAEAETLRVKLRDALARFDAIRVVVDEPTSQKRYQLTASADYDDAGLAVLAARLVDTSDGTVAYAKTFSRDDRDGREQDSVRDPDAIVREVSASLAQSYGIIQSRERSKDLAGEGGETQYRCLLEAYDYWRSFDPQQHLRGRECLERMIAANPGFALGYAALAPLLLQEYHGVNTRPDEPSALQRALVAARHAVELRPASARAHQALADVQFARGDYPLAVEAGERAVMLNPYDPYIVADFGRVLVSLGEHDRGARLMRQAAGTLIVRPVWQDFVLFLSAYLADDPAGAARYAARMTSETYPLALVAHALVAAQGGEPDRARRLFDRLVAAHPAWRKNSRDELAKYFPAEAIRNRLAHDIAMIETVASQ